MRTRIKVDDYIREDLIYEAFSLAVDPPNNVTDSIETGREYGVMADVEVKDFRKRVAAGELFFNPLYVEELSFSRKPAIWTLDYIKNSPSHTASYIVMPDKVESVSSSSLIAPLIDQYCDQFEQERGVAVAKAWANVDETELLAYATIGELPETVRWIADLYRRGLGVVKLFTSKKARLRYEFKSKKVSATDQADAMSNMWLEMRYAVRPLLFEMEQLVAALANQGSPPRRTARGYNEKDTSNTVDNRIDVDLGMTIRKRVTTQRQSTYRAGVLYNVDIADKSWAAVLGLDQPIETIWELTRLSFLLDWFFNVGTLLAAWTPNANLIPLGSWVTEEHIITTTGFYNEFKLDPLTPPWHFVVKREEPGGTKAVHRIKRRTACPDRPVLPSIKINLDWAKITDIAAIARSFCRALRF